MFKCHQDVYNNVVCDIKFHDISYAMQAGIWLEYLMNINTDGFLSSQGLGVAVMSDLSMHMANYFSYRESKLKP